MNSIFHAILRKLISKSIPLIFFQVSVRTSSKRHLILMSPFERKSEARRIMKTTDLRGICSLSETRRNMFGYYRTSEIARNGSGDENITIIQSPSTEGITASIVMQYTKNRSKISFIILFLL